MAATRTKTCLITAWVLISPLLLLLCLWIYYPHIVDRLFGLYVPSAKFKLVSNANREGRILDLAVFMIYSKRFLLETLTRIYHVLLGGALLAGLMTFLGAVAWMFGRRLRERFSSRLPFGPAALFFAFLGVLLVSWPSAGAPLFSALCLFSFALNHWDSGEFAAFRPWRPLFFGIVLLSPTGLLYFLAPALLFFLCWRCLRPGLPDSAFPGSAPVRVFFCFLSLYALCLGYLSMRPIPLSGDVVRISGIADLYDLEVDEVGGNLFVTKKRSQGEANLAVLPLENPSGTGNAVYFQTKELEDIAIDQKRRIIYHVDRGRNILLMVDADRMKVLHFMYFPFDVPSSTKLELAPERGMLAISIEDVYGDIPGRLLLFDLHAGQMEQIDYPKVNPIVIADDGAGLWYVHKGKTPSLLAMKMESLRVVGEARVPEADLRMAFSPELHELYVPDPVGGCVWVLSTPDLTRKRTLSAAWGVRAIAVDENANLLFAASLVTGCLQVIDLQSGETLGRHYVGRYCRRVAVDPVRRRAYLTSAQDGLFMLEY